MLDLETIDPHDWHTVAPHYAALQAATLTPEQVPAWLARWSELDKVLLEAEAVAQRAVAEDTTDADAQQRYEQFTTAIKPQVEQAAQALKHKLLELTDFEPGNEHRELLRHMRADADLYHEGNVQLRATVDMRANDYHTITGAWTVRIDDQDRTMQQAAQRLRDPERNTREAAWRAMEERSLRDSAALDVLFLDLLQLRRQLARNAGLPNYRAYRWRELKRFDYTPDDSLALHAAIEAEVVPLTARLDERRRAQLGVATLRPWDRQVDSLGRDPLTPFTLVDDLEAGVGHIFAQLDPEFGAQWAGMRNGYLDLASRTGKAPGGYCDYFPRTGMPYIFMNAVGTQADVITLVHEAGHAFHAFAASAAQPLIWNLRVPMEFSELAAIAMELLSLPYLSAERGGFYVGDDVHRAVYERFEGIVYGLPLLTRIDAFQHWLYADAPENVSAATIDAKWDELLQRYDRGVDWSGLEASRAKTWQRVLHLFVSPFYMIEYVLALLGALQVWRNAQHDARGALQAYQAALALGNTRPLPELYRAAGARLAFDRPTVHDLVDLLARQLDLA